MCLMSGRVFTDISFVHQVHRNTGGNRSLRKAGEDTTGYSCILFKSTIRIIN